MTRVALFGCGWIQDFHARGVLAHGDELVAVANHREESARAFADRYAIPRVTTDWEALAADPEVDAAVVATPNALHAPQTIALLRNGKHVMVEKPMAISVAECDAMIAASRDGGASLMVAHCWRFRDEVRAMRDRIVSGELGDVVQDPRLRRARRMGAERVVHGPRARRGRRARRHGRARDRHRAVPARRPRARRRLRGDRHALRRGSLHGRRRRRPVDHLERRRHERGGVGVVAAAPGRARGGHGGLRHEGVRADLAARASVRRLRALHHSRCTARRSPSSWTRSARDARRGRRARTAASSCRSSRRPTVSAGRSR